MTGSTGRGAADRQEPAGALRAQRVLLTRSDEDNAAWADELRRHGVEAVSLPCIRSERLDSPELAAALSDAAGGADWLVFTSRRGVEAFARLVGERRPAARVAAVGRATAETAERLLGRVDLIPEHATADGLADALERRVPTLVVVLALAENAPDTLARRLTAAGAACRRFDVYRTAPAPERSPKTPLAELGVDAVFLASPSAVAGFVNQIDADASARLVAIGPSTAQAAEAAGLTLHAEAGEPTLTGLLEAMQ